MLAICLMAGGRTGGVGREPGQRGGGDRRQRGFGRGIPASSVGAGGVSVTPSGSGEAVGTAGSAAAGTASASTFGTGSYSSGPNGGSDSAATGGAVDASGGKTFDRSGTRTRGDRTVDYTADGARDNGDVTRSRTRTMVNGDDLRSVTVSGTRLPDGDRTLTRTRTTVDGDDVASRTITRTSDPGQKPTVSRSQSTSTLPQ